MGEPAFQLDLEHRYTYADYLTWPDDVRCELIEGSIYMMSPAPTVRHQDVVGEVFRQLANQLKGKGCRPFVSPLDVRLPKISRKKDDEETVVQPDVLLLCDASKLDARGVRGAPDWVMEVLSPGTASKDQILKRRIYEAAGVREYWTVHPLDGVATMYVLEQGRFSPPEMVEMRGTTALHILPEVLLDWDELPPLCSDDVL